MRLAAFISANYEAILTEWEAFARQIGAGQGMDSEELRDHADAMLRAIVADMALPQSASEQSNKSMGRTDAAQRTLPVAGTSADHAKDRAAAGFDLFEMISEYRALRASVLRLWRESGPTPHLSDLDDLGRFDEAIDQSMTIAVRAYTESVERSRRLFLAILGHDLRDPLHAIRMAVSELASDLPLDPDSAALTANIQATIAAMGRLVTDLIDFSASATGADMPVTPAPMDLGELAEQAVAQTRANAGERAIRVRRGTGGKGGKGGEGREGDLRGEWDAARLRQVIANLVGNAVQHGTGPIDVLITDAGHEVVLSVHNAGPPIPPDVLRTIFDPGMRARAAERRVREGSAEGGGRAGRGGRGGRPGSLGLGLYVARAIVRGHGGRIDIDSSEEAGTTVTVRLPRSSAASSSSSPSPSSSSPAAAASTPRSSPAAAGEMTPKHPR